MAKDKAQIRYDGCVYRRWYEINKGKTLQKMRKDSNRLVRDYYGFGIMKLRTLNGKTQSATAWAKEYGIPLGRFWSRIHNGWTIEAAMYDPKRVVQSKT